VTPATAHAPRCAPTSRDVGEPLAGTAPEARTWLAVEQSGPWGRDAVTESHLDAVTGRTLAARADGTGVRIALIRRPGRHADNHHTPSHRAVWIAHTAPGITWMRRLDLPDARALLDLDLAAVGAGVEPTVGTPDRDPLLLVCSNSKRDQCCAIEGRPLATELAITSAGRVWEASHLGGHRFAPTAVLLPHGLVHGRLDTSSGERILATSATGRIDLATLRGRSCWSGPGQAAEVHVRETFGLDGLDDVIDVIEHVGPDASPSWSVSVHIADGHIYDTVVRAVVENDVLRPESCVKPAVPLRSYAVESTAPTR